MGHEEDNGGVMEVEISYVKCIRETGTDITPGKTYQVISVSNSVPMTIRFVDDAGFTRTRPIKSSTHILYEFAYSKEEEEKVSCL
jgi:hypothetical protein